MKIIALIPARYESTRFPGKLLKKIGEKSIICHVYDNMVATGLFDEVAVVCNHQIIYDELVSHGGKVFMSTTEHDNGTSRIAEIAAKLDFPLVFNVQGDEPFVHKDILSSLIDIFRNDVNGGIEIVSPMTEIWDDEMINNPNVVKVVTNIHQEAMYFSRSPIPYYRNRENPRSCYKHIGIYGFRKEALLKIVNLPETPLDGSEMIECIKYLEHGMKIKMALTRSQGVSIDTPEDLEKAIDFYSKNG